MHLHTNEVALMFRWLNSRLPTYYYVYSWTPMESPHTTMQAQLRLWALPGCSLQVTACCVMASSGRGVKSQYRVWRLVSGFDLNHWTISTQSGTLPELHAPVCESAAALLSCTLILAVTCISRKCELETTVDDTAFSEFLCTWTLIAVSSAVYHDSIYVDVYSTEGIMAVW